jgi:hypothetical protein
LKNRNKNHVKMSTNGKKNQFHVCIAVNAIDTSTLQLTPPTVAVFTACNTLRLVRPFQFIYRRMNTKPATTTAAMKNPNKTALKAVRSMENSP